jgi:ABC-type transporter Mla subunit MlaD
MAIPLPRPGAVVGLTRSALDQALGSAASFAAVPARAFAVLDEVEALLRRINGVVDRIEGTLDRTDRVLDDAETAVREVAVISAAATGAIETATEVAAAAAVVVGDAERVSAAAALVVGEAEAVAGRAAGTVATAEAAAGTAADLLSAYEPALRRAAPMAARFVEELSPEEVTAAIRLVDELPKLKEHMTSDVLPILATLDRVGPDLHDLLDVTRDLKLAVAGIPGLGMLRRRGERRTDEPDIPGTRAG